MVFIAILLALALERFFDWGHLRRWQWYDQYCQKINPLTAQFNSSLRLACCLAPPVLIVGLIEFILSGWMYGFLRFLFTFIVLIYCFGPVNFWAQLYDSLQKSDAPPVMDTEEKIRAIFIEGYRRVFAVLFWFAVAGPMGAVLYRLVVLTDNAHAKSLEAIMDWLPSRLLGFLFALGGHFVKVLNQWKKYALQGHNSDAIVSETGVAALELSPAMLAQSSEGEKAAIQLFDRALIMMLVISAILVLVMP